MWMVCCWQLIASNIPALNTRVQMERIASNIAGNIARCGCPFSHTAMAAAVQAKMMSNMITSMELQRPKMTPVIPQWNLDIIQEALSKPPYVPLWVASLKHLSLKTVFLLATVSARRRSEL